MGQVNACVSVVGAGFGGGLGLGDPGCAELLANLSRHPAQQK
jgi:hypothetical protein